MKKPLYMIWIGAETELMTAGQAYKIIGKVKMEYDGNGGKYQYAYIFKNDKGDEDTAMSFLFASCKGKRYANPFN